MKNFIKTIISAIKCWVRTYTNGELSNLRADIEVFKNTTEEVNSTKMNIENPVGVGSFSMNRDIYSPVGEFSYAEGDNTKASGIASHAEGSATDASGYSSHAEGISTSAYGESSHSEGCHTMALGDYSHAEGYKTQALGENSHAGGCNTIATAKFQQVGGKYNLQDAAVYEFSERAYKVGSKLSEAVYCSSEIEVKNGTVKLVKPITSTIDKIKSTPQIYWAANLNNNAVIFHNIDGTYSYRSGSYYLNTNQVEAVPSYSKLGQYVHIVGNGTSSSEPSNAYTLDWDGNAWFAGNVYVGGSNQSDDMVERLATISDVNKRALCYSEIVQREKTMTSTVSYTKNKIISDHMSELAWQLKNNLNNCTFEYSTNIKDYYPLRAEGIRELNDDYVITLYNSYNKLIITMYIYNDSNDTVNTNVHTTGVIYHEIRIITPCREEVVHKLESKYLPDGTPILETAEVGQMIVVSEVDENSKPVAWEATTLTASDVGALPSDTIIPSIDGLATTEEVNSAISQKSQVQIVTWGADD